jgi:hypothetical protein
VYRNRRWAPITALLLPVALLTAACGGDDTAGSDSASGGPGDRSGTIVISGSSTVEPILPGRDETLSDTQARWLPRLPVPDAHGRIVRGVLFLAALLSIVISVLIVGTLIVTVIAMAVAVPLGLGAAVYLSEYAPAACASC